MFILTGHGLSSTEDFEEIEIRVKSLEEGRQAESVTSQAVIKGQFNRIEALLENLHLKAEQVSKSVYQMTAETIQPQLKGNSTSKSEFVAANSPSSQVSFFMTVGSDGIEKYYGSSSMLMLIRDAGIGLQDRLNNPECLAETDTIDEAFRFLLDVSKIMFYSATQILDTQLNQGNEAITLPPESLVNALIQPFLQDFNSIYPMFDPQQLSDQAKKIYTSADIHNITLHSLWLNTLVSHTLSARCRSKVQDSNDRVMDTELLRPFMDNIRCAVSGLGRFFQPGIINVQTLVSLVRQAITRCLSDYGCVLTNFQCIFARDNFNIELAEFLLEQACHCARRMGLHRQDFLSEEDSSRYPEQRNIFWNLFILDKSIFFLAGKPCLLPGYDCDVQAPSPENNIPSQQYFSSRVDLAMIEEQIYTDLYSAKTQVQKGCEREDTVNRLCMKIQQWLDEHHEILSRCEFAPKDHYAQYLGLEQTIICGLCRVMVLRKSCAKVSAAKSLRVSREVMENLNTLAEKPDLQGKEASLRR